MDRDKLTDILLDELFVGFAGMPRLNPLKSAIEWSLYVYGHKPRTITWDITIDEIPIPTVIDNLMESWK